MAPIVAVVVAVAEAVASVATEVAAIVGSIAEGVGGGVGIGAAEAGALGAEAGALGIEGAMGSGLGAEALGAAGAGAIGAETFAGLGPLAEGVVGPIAAGAEGLAGPIVSGGVTGLEMASTGLLGLGGKEIAGTGITTADVQAGLGAAGVGESLYSMLSTPSIPKADMSALNAQIAGNAALSNQARATAQDALAKYSTGVLSSAYQGMYQAQYDQQLAQVRQQLAVRGFTEDSTQWQSAMQSFNQWDANLKGILLQNQLSDAVKASGMTDQAAQDLFKKWGLTTEQQRLTAWQQQQAGKTMAGVGTGLAKLFPETKTKTPTTTPPTPSGIAGLFAPQESVIGQPAAGGGGWGGGIGEELP